MNKGFEILISDGDYLKHKTKDDYEIEGKIYGTLGGWRHLGKKSQNPIEAEMYDEPYYSLQLDPTRSDAHTKEEVVKIAIKFVFERFGV